MTMAVSIPRWALLGFLLVSMSCTSGGTGGSGSPVVAVGTVTGFGSIVVNGVKFDTTDATIILNGRRGSEADLQLGHVVTVRGTRGPNGTVATAETVAVDNSAEGPIDSIDLATNHLVVLGQIVRIDDRTQFGDTPLSALEIGNIVEVSGFADADGVLRATRVEKTQDVFTPGTEIEIEGIITTLDDENQTFMLNTLQVDFSTAQLINLPGNQLRNGQIVEVKSAQTVVNGVLLADSIAVKNVGVTGAHGEAIELQGIIIRVLAADTFEVDDQPVRLTPATGFEGGTAADIAVNVPVKVDGFFDAEGVLVAVEIDFLQ